MNPELRVADSVLELIGGTPVVRVCNNEDTGSCVYAKLEGMNAAGSVKDRPARGMIAAAELAGTLEPGMTIVEASSGNTGIALSMIGALKRYPVTIVAPDNITPERRQLMEFYGARIVESEGILGTKGSIAVAAELVAGSAKYHWTNQYANPANPRAHYETTGVEIVRALPGVDVIVAGIGSGGTLMGVGRRAREHNPAVRMIGVEPFPGAKVFGLRNLEEDCFTPPILDLGAVDGRMLVRSRDAFATVRRVGRHNGLFLGMSAGAVLSAAMRIASSEERCTIVAILADAGWKYLSTGIWRDDSGDVDVENLLDLTW